ncbi:GAF domain-containing protein [Candidatus Leptofilum sp.]|uniref:GAF domain-containing protein n=1 Tax=Candidatus Leptofilum sp. TaxID=3241576 RepID=UPI003B5CAA47
MNQHANLRTWLIQVVIVAGAYFGVSRLGLVLSFPETAVSPVWPATGVAVAAFMLWGKRIWPGIVLGELLSFTAVYPLDAFPPITYFLFLLISISDGSLEGFSSTYLVQHWTGSRKNPFANPQNAVKFILAVMLGTTTSATLGVTSLLWVGSINWADVGPLWQTWWTGNVLGALIITPFLCVWLGQERPTWTPRRLIESFFVFGLLAVIAWLTFNAPAILPFVTVYRLEYLVIAILVWVALRLGRHGATAGILATAAAAVWYTVQNIGPFIAETAVDSILALQTYLAVVTVSTLAIAAALAERAKIGQAQRQSEERFAIAFRSSPDSIMISSLADGRFLEVNERFLQSTGYSRDEVIDHTAFELELWTDPGQRDQFIQILQVQGAVRNFEAGYHLKSGETGVVLMSAEMIKFNGEDCLLTISRDISQRKQAELALQQSAERLEKLHKAERRQREIAESLLKTGTAVASSLDLGQILLTLSRQLREIGGFQGSIIYGLDQERQQIYELAADARISRLPETGMTYQLTDYPTAEHALTSGEPAIMHRDHNHTSETELAFMQYIGVTTLLVLPLRTKERIIGLVTIGDTTDTLAHDQAALTRCQEVLHEAAAWMGAPLWINDSEDLLALAEKLVTISNYRVCYLWAWKPAARIMHVAAIYSELIWSLSRGPASRIADYPLLASVLESDEPVFVWPDAEEEVAERGKRTLVGFPLRLKDETIGLVELTHFTKALTVGDDTLRLLGAIIDQAAIAIAHAQLYAASEQRAARLNALHQIDQGILTAEPIEGIIRAALKHVRSLTPSVRASVPLIDWATNEAETLVVEANGVSPQSQEGSRVSLAPFANMVAALQRGQIVEIKADQALEQISAPLRAEGMRSGVHIPLIVQDELFGSLNLWESSPGAFLPKHIEIAQEVAAQLAIAIHQTRLREQIKQHTEVLEQHVAERTTELARQYRRQAALADVELAINQPRELKAVLDRIVQITTELLPASGGASIILWEPQTERFSQSASTVPQQPPAAGARRVRRRSGATRWIVDHCEPVVVTDIRDDPFSANRMLTEFGLQAYAGVPLLDGADALGVLYALDQQPRTYTPDDLDFLTAVANRAAAAITKVQLYEETTQRAAELAALYEVGKEITATLELDTMLQTIVDRAIQVTNADKSVILLVDVAEERLIRVVKSGFRREEISPYSFAEVEQGISGWVLRQKKPTLVADISTDERNRGVALADAKRSGDKAAAVAPLLIRDEVIGTLTVINGRNKEPFTSADLNLVTSLAGQAAIAIENARLYEAAQEADRLKSAFLASMSHELRTPLNSIIGFTGIILQELAGPLNDEQKKQLGMVRSSSRHLLALINDVLDISKIGANQMELSLSAFNVRDVVNKVVKSVIPLAVQKGLAISVSFKPEVGPIVSDQRRVEQIFINLINNAIKYSNRGEIKIEGRVVDNELEMRIVDTGIGIKAEDIDKLFQPFRQIDMGTDRVHEGTGLGLSICQQLVEMLGGKIWAESEWGVGSTFTFTLPLSVGVNDEN